MTVKVRLSGEPDQIAAVVAVLRETFETAGGDRAYPNRGSFGVRVYLELRPTPTANPTTTGNTRRKS
ncbi:hypothetical protein ACWGID_29285 [Kribbella sp. NPDC054772]